MLAHSCLAGILTLASAVVGQAVGRDPRLETEIDEDAARMMIQKEVAPLPRHTRRRREISLGTAHGLARYAGILFGWANSAENTSDAPTNLLKKDTFVKHFAGTGLISPGGRRRVWNGLFSAVLWRGGLRLGLHLRLGGGDFCELGACCFELRSLRK